MSRLLLAEELFASVMDHRQVSTGIVSAVCVMPWSGEITSAWLVSQIAIAASDAEYFTIALERWRYGSQAVVATRTTQATGGAAIAARVPWSIGALNAANRVVQKDDVIAVRVTRTLGSTVATFSANAFTVGVRPD
jgi:hypothetical protein